MLEESTSAHGRAQPEPAFDAEGLTFQAAGLDAEECAGALREHGTVLVRGVMPKHLFPPIIDDVEGYFRWLTKGERLQEVALYASYGNIFFATAADFGSQSLMNVLYHLMAPPMSEALYTYFQAERISVFLGYSFIRRHWRTDTMSLSPFHQDSVAVPVPAPMLSCWVPLTRCGVTAPGLEVVAQRLDTALPITDKPATNHVRMEIDAALVERHYGENLWHPEFDAGDAMLFDSKCVHRTHVTEAMSAVRYSVELRFVATSLAPPEWVESKGDLLIAVPPPSERG